ncbi:DUF3135 domain-containing protein [Shewanella sp. A3A]|uniref:DUF3135 domain-containing protein n=1 Tax=Shewanella electrica TaxID=515560 RepID=A0ABT2FQM6_9GAMM|nr:DUF3135 domain-containing protein [Shewanella electrica]MCH1921407.1 DUF3135 domain-containing protein [Shewanella ferrihydritica]MCH1927025.1 DUF3135 domain-containing protein [Shewanella electrica]MCS4558620.1 DUF3135 domain-containing protein [Shewanella electrica]
MAELPDFDTLMWMAQHSPAELDQLQQNLSEELISNAGKNAWQLRAVNQHLTHKLARCSNPYQRCITTVTLMRNKFDSLAQVLQDPEHFRNNVAQVLPFKRKSA